MLAALLLALSSPADDALATERAFAAAAQRDGQWTAFREYADEDAILFTPRPTDAREALEGTPDPAIAVHWWPARSWISCNGRLAVHTGPWMRADQSRVGYFVTIWLRQADGSWRWLIHDEADLDEPMALGEEVEIRQASCAEDARRIRHGISATGELPPGVGASGDGTLGWSWRVAPNGRRVLTIRMSTGESIEEVFVHRAGPPLR